DDERVTAQARDREQQQARSDQRHRAERPHRDLANRERKQRPVGAPDEGEDDEQGEGAARYRLAGGGWHGARASHDSPPAANRGWSRPRVRPRLRAESEASAAAPRAVPDRDPDPAPDPPAAADRPGDRAAGRRSATACRAGRATARCARASASTAATCRDVVARGVSSRAKARVVGVSAPFPGRQALIPRLRTRIFSVSEDAGDVAVEVRLAGRAASPGYARGPIHFVHFDDLGRLPRPLASPPLSDPQREAARLQDAAAT